MADEPLMYPVVLHRYRILFYDGEVADVIAPRDDSTVRQWANEQHYGKAEKKFEKGEGIAGVVHLGEFRQDDSGP